MSSQKRSHEEVDPDYDETVDENIKLKHQKVLEKDGQNTVVKKIQSIVRREFHREINNKEDELQEIDKKLNEARQFFDRLKACIVASYYGMGKGVSSTTISQSSVSAPPASIHPAVKKLVGKTPRQHTNDLELLHSSSDMGKKSSEVGEIASRLGDASLSKTHYYCSQGPSKSFAAGQLVSGATPMERHSLPTSKVPTYDDRRARFKVKKKIIVGNVSKYIPIDQREANDMSSHKWMVYVRGPKANPDISGIVKKVWFFLHHSYKPNDLIEIKSPPFHLTRRGWGEFPVRVQLHFVDIRSKNVDIIHHLKLDKTYTGLQTLGAETVVEVELERDFFEPIPKPCDASSASSSPIPFSNSPTPHSLEYQTSRRSNISGPPHFDYSRACSSDTKEEIITGDDDEENLSEAQMESQAIIDNENFELKAANDEYHMTISHEDSLQKQKESDVKGEIFVDVCDDSEKQLKPQSNHSRSLLAQGKNLLNSSAILQKQTKLSSGSANSSPRSLSPAFSKGNSQVLIIHDPSQIKLKPKNSISLLGTSLLASKSTPAASVAFKPLQGQALGSAITSTSVNESLLSSGFDQKLTVVGVGGLGQKLNPSMLSSATGTAAMVKEKPGVLCKTTELSSAGSTSTVSTSTSTAPNPPKSPLINISALPIIHTQQNIGQSTQGNILSRPVHTNVGIVQHKENLDNTNRFQPIITEQILFNQIKQPTSSKPNAEMIAHISQPQRPKQVSLLTGKVVNRPEVVTSSVPQIVPMARVTNLSGAPSDIKAKSIAQGQGNPAKNQMLLLQKDGSPVVVYVPNLIVPMATSQAKTPASQTSLTVSTQSVLQNVIHSPSLSSLNLSTGPQGISPTMGVSLSGNGVPINQVMLTIPPKLPMVQDSDWMDEPKMSAIGITKHGKSSARMQHKMEGVVGQTDEERKKRQYEILKMWKERQDVPQQQLVKSRKFPIIDELEGQMEQVTQIEVTDFHNMQAFVKACVKLHPVVQSGVNKLTHPYCAQNLEEWNSWPIGKQRAAEWHRACFVLKYQKACLAGATEFKGEKLMTTRELVNWCRLYAFSPVCPFVASRRWSQQDADADSDVSETSDEGPLQSVTCKSDVEKRLECLSASRADEADPNIDVLFDEPHDPGRLVKNETIPVELGKKELLPSSSGALFVLEEMRKRGTKYQPYEIVPGVVAHTSAEAVFQAMVEFGNDIVRKAICVHSQRTQPQELLSVQDVHKALGLIPEASFCCNHHLGKNKDETFEAENESCGAR